MYQNSLKKLWHEYVANQITGPDTKPILKQLYECVVLTASTLYFPQNYFKYSGYKKDKSLSDVAQYVPGRLFDHFRSQYLNKRSYCVLVDDKLVFNRLLSSLNAPVTTLIGSYLPLLGFRDSLNQTISIRELADSIGNGAVVKPTNASAQGAGVEILRRSDFAEMRVVEERISHAARLADKHGYNLIVEDLIRQHDFMSEIYVDSVNTIRLDTIITTHGEVEIVSAFARFGRNGRRVDNWSGLNSGIGVAIDLDTGKLRSIGVDYRLNEYEAHPDSGVSFANIEIPCWGSVVDCVQRAATAIPELKSIGWDVAVTESGPIIIEANSDYSLQASQACSGPYFQNRVFITAIRQHCELIGNSYYTRFFNREFGSTN